MTKRRDTILILEDSPARTQKFERVLQSELPGISAYVANNTAEMIANIALTVRL